VRVRRGKAALYDCGEAATHWQKFKGITFKRSFTPLLFDFGSQGKHAIHSLFCPPFWAVWMDSRKRVVEVEKVKPWRFWVEPRKPARYLIETADKRGVRQGDLLRW